MTTNVTHRITGVVENAPQAPAAESPGEPSTASTAEQLSLLTTSPLPLQFRLSRTTRERGLAHIAAIRKELAARSGSTDQAREGEAA